MAHVVELFEASLKLLTTLERQKVMANIPDGYKLAVIDPSGNVIETIPLGADWECSLAHKNDDGSFKGQ